MGSPLQAAAVDVTAAETDRIVAEWLTPSALARIGLRAKYAQNPDPQAYLKELRALPELPKGSAELACLLPGAARKGIPARAAERAVLTTYAFPSLRSMTPKTAEELRHKEAVYVARMRQAFTDLRDDLWRMGSRACKPVLDQRGWGVLPPELPKIIHESKRNRKDNRMSLQQLWLRWPAPFVQLREEWDEIYVECFPEVVDEPAAPGTAKWKSFYSPFSRDFVAWPSILTQRLMNWKELPQHRRNFTRSVDVLADLDAIVLRLDKRIGRAPSRDRAIWEDRVVVESSAKVVVDAEAASAAPAEEAAAQPPADWKAAVPQPVRRTKRPLKPKQWGSPESSKKKAVETPAVPMAGPTAVSQTADIEAQDRHMLETLTALAGSSPAGIDTDIGGLHVLPGSIDSMTAYRILHRVTVDAMAILIRGVRLVTEGEPIMPERAESKPAAPIEFKGPTEEVCAVARPLAELFPGLHRRILLQKEPARLIEAGRRLAGLANCAVPTTQDETLATLAFVVGHLVSEPAAIVSLIVEILTWDLPHAVGAESASAAAAVPKAVARKVSSKQKGAAPKGATRTEGDKARSGDLQQRLGKPQATAASERSRGTPADVVSVRSDSSKPVREKAAEAGEFSGDPAVPPMVPTPALTRAASLESLADIPLPPLISAEEVAGSQVESPPPTEVPVIAEEGKEFKAGAG